MTAGLMWGAIFTRFGPEILYPLAPAEQSVAGPANRRPKLLGQRGFPALPTPLENNGGRLDGDHLDSILNSAHGERRDVPVE